MFELSLFNAPCPPPAFPISFSWPRAPFTNESPPRPTPSPMHACRVSAAHHSPQLRLQRSSGQGRIRLQSRAKSRPAPRTMQVFKNSILRPVEFITASKINLVEPVQAVRQVLIVAELACQLEQQRLQGISVLPHTLNVTSPMTRKCHWREAGGVLWGMRGRRSPAELGRIRMGDGGLRAKDFW